MTDPAGDSYFDALDAAAQRARRRTRTLEVVSSRYRCRAHHHQPVTASGAGCPSCDSARMQAAQHRADRRTESRARTLRRGRR